MQTAHIPADGSWHPVSDKRVRSVHISRPGEADIKPDGIGWARWPAADDRRLLPVDYELIEESPHVEA